MKQKNLAAGLAVLLLIFSSAIHFARAVVEPPEIKQSETF